MAIVKNSFSVARMGGGDFSQGTVSSREEDESSTSLACSSGEDGASDADSGMGVDEIDLSEFGEPEMEFCQVGNQSCSIPLELYDVTDLRDVLSLETWNSCLTEQERFALTEYLPDMEQEGFALNLKELFSGKNFFFGNPFMKFFNMLRGGLCDPRIVLYRQGLNLLRQHHYYHMLREYQNSMVESLHRMRSTWMSCDGYSIEHKVRVLNILRKQKSLCYDKDGDYGSETGSESGGDSFEAYGSKKFSLSREVRKSSQRLPFEDFSRGSRMAMEPVRLGKEKAKGILKVAAPKMCRNGKGNFPMSFDSGTEKKTELAKQKDYCSDLLNGRGCADSWFKERSNRLVGQGEWNVGSRTTMARTGSIKLKDKMDLPKRYGRDVLHDFGEDDREKYVELPDYLGRGTNSNQEVTVASYDYDYVNSGKKLKHSAKNSKFHAKDGGVQYHLPKISQASAATRSVSYHKVDDESVVDRFDGYVRGKKLKAEVHHRSNMSRCGFDSKVNSYKIPPVENGEPLFLPDNKMKNSYGKLRDKSFHQQGVSNEYSRDRPIYEQSEETESDSSDKVEEDGDNYPYATKGSKSCIKDNTHLLGGVMSGTPEDDQYSKNVKKKGKTKYNSNLNEGKSVRKGQVEHITDKLQPSSLAASYTSKRKRKGSANLHRASQQADKTCKDRSNNFDEDGNNFVGNTSLPDGQMQTDRSDNKDQIPNDFVRESDHYQSSDIPKGSGKGEDGYPEDLEEPSYQQLNSKRQIENSCTVKKKGKKKANAIAVSTNLLTPDRMISEKGVSEMEIDVKAQKKAFTLITPTIHTGFSFSIIHLLSAIRKALVSPHIEDNPEVCNHHEKDVMQAKQEDFTSLIQVANGVLLSHSQDHMEGSILEPGGQTTFPSLTIQEIVNCVKSNPGDPCILETQEPLQDLVRGALRIFSSRTAPLGAKGWKALVSYEKSSKSWAWVGPLSVSLSDNDNAEETSAETWSIPQKMLVKLVDAFANWLKSGQETLRQIGSLPAPPAVLPVLDEKERFRDLRAQRSLNTIRPSSEEIRAYFRKEEHLRYSIPDRAFQYTAVDGRKSIVAPLRRGGGKPTSKARDHFMLKPDRPPHVTVLCLVRDSAARLPGSVGTRADVCTLIRDSQYIVEDVTDAQINQVVSGALDRLHYERDPCVQFDGDRKLWVYLHRDREDEDFEDDGTSSTKKWKRQRKDATDNNDMAAINDSNHLTTGDLTTGDLTTGDLTTGDLTAVGSCEYDFQPDLNVDSSAINIGDNGELVYSDLRPTMENFQTYMNTAHSGRRHDNPISWEVLGVNNLQDDKMLCRENSTSKDFDDQSCSSDRTAGFLSGSLL